MTDEYTNDPYALYREAQADQMARCYEIAAKTGLTVGQVFGQLGERDSRWPPHFRTYRLIEWLDELEADNG